MCRVLPGILCCLMVFVSTVAAAPALRVIKAVQSGTALLRNGGFEAKQGEAVAVWRAWKKGFVLTSGAGRGGSAAIVCVNSGTGEETGASQTLALNRTGITPLVVRGWSKAEKVSGNPDGGYSLYVDLIYEDDTPLWGQTVNFATGTHDWEQRELLILPQKPVKSATIYCLFRGHTGQAVFDDVTVEEIKVEGGAVVFQGIPVRIAPTRRQSTADPINVATQDHLRLTLRDNAITSWQAGARKFQGYPLSGFMVRDVAADSDFYFVQKGACPELGLKLETRFTPQADHIAVAGRLTDTTGKDRALSLVFALPLSALGWQWADDMRRSRSIKAGNEYSNTVAVRSGSTGTMSVYPLAAVSNDRTGVALALDMASPAQYRLGYNAGTQQFFIAYDFGLVKDTERSPGSASFRFVIYHFDAPGGFRAALAKLYTIFPDAFVTRSKEQGLWMPFTDVSTVQGWQDFGFRYHEGKGNVPFDDANGILSFRYTEPMTWWMPMPKDVPRTIPEALRVRDEWAAGADERQRRMAVVSRSAAMTNRQGQPALLFRNEPWADGAVWSLNPNPHLPTAPNAATVHWDDAIKQQLYGPAAKGQLDGEYLDSLEGYVTADLNFRREHFRHTTVPLTFATESKQPALHKGLAVYEFTKWLAEDVHRMGKLMFANGVPSRISFLCPHLDVMGTETNWLHGKKYQPASDVSMSLWRAMSYQKPYLLLMNTNYETFTPDFVEKYFQRSLFYGIWPGMFSHNAADKPYWQNPSWYNRDRPLFKKYIPLVRSVATAGWQPVTEATCNNGGIFIERFGPDAGGAVYFTFLNDTAQPQEGMATINAAALRLDGTLAAQEMISGQAVTLSGARFPVVLQPQQVWLVRVTPAD